MTTRGLCLMILAVTTGAVGSAPARAGGRDLVAIVEMERQSSRVSNEPGYRWNALGFRVVKSIP